MRPIALYNRKGERLLTLKEAERRGYGSVDALKQRIFRGTVRAHKVGQLLLVPEVSLPRPVRRRKARAIPRRKARPRR